jgi:hypothetical protein
MDKICIYGAGAVGGFIGALLARSGSRSAQWPATRPWSPSSATAFAVSLDQDEAMVWLVLRLRWPDQWWPRPGSSMGHTIPLNP